MYHIIKSSKVKANLLYAVFDLVHKVDKKKLWFYATYEVIEDAMNLCWFFVSEVKGECNCLYRNWLNNLSSKHMFNVLLSNMALHVTHKEKQATTLGLFFHHSAICLFVHLSFIHAALVLHGATRHASGNTLVFTGWRLKILNYVAGVSMVSCYPTNQGLKYIFFFFIGK